MREMSAPAWMPSPSHAQLVRAAIAEGDAARAAWAQWKADAAGTKLDHPDQRVVLLVYRKLQQQGFRDPMWPKFAEMYKRTWSLNQMAMRHMEDLLAAFAARGIETMVLKGAALLLRYYRDLGTRPMGDFDVLVPLAQTEAAMAVLVERGWQGHKPLHLAPAEGRTPFHGMGYRHADKLLGCDLHWHVIHMNLAEHYDAPLWAAAEPLQVGKVMSRILCAEHQLIHIMFNGCMNEGGGNLRWLLDALTVLGQERQLEWDRVVAQCQRLEFVQPAAAMLAYLRREWAVEVPTSAIEALANTPVRFAIRKVYEGLDTYKPQRSGLQVFWILYTQYQLSHARESGGFSLDFIRFLRYRWSLDGGIRQTLRYAWKRTRGVDAEDARRGV